MTKKKLKLIGFWLSKENPGFPIPIENSDNIDEKTRLVILDYLDSGNTVARYKGCSKCRICGCMNGSTEISDGEYLWPSGLEHYVSKHHVKLPEDFINKVVQRK